MMSQAEKQDLLYDPQRESKQAAPTVIKCAAGLLIVIGCALLGSFTDPRDVRVEQASAQPRYSASLAESKIIFDQRRERFKMPEPRRPEIAQQ